MSEKIVLMAAHGPEDPERATIPFVMATAAQASDVEALIGLQADGVRLASKNIADGIEAASFPPLKQLLDLYLEAGGKLYVCGPCASARKIGPGDLIPGAEIVNAVTFIQACTEATSTLVY